MPNIKKQLVITIGSKTYSDRLNAYFQKNNRFVLRHLSEEASIGHSKSIDQLYNEILSIISTEKFNLNTLVAFGRSSVLGSVENIALAIEKVSNAHGSSKIKVIAPPSKSACIFSNKLKTTLELRKFTKNILSTTAVSDKNLLKVAAMLDDGKFPKPAVLKATNLTGGAGIVLITSGAELILKYSLFKKQGIQEFILTEYCVGPETSVEILSLGEQQFVYPMALKESTNDSLTHADNKIKISGYVNNIPHLDKEVLMLCNEYKIQGYFSLEGIIYDSVENRWKIMEGMTRFTGNYPMVNGSNIFFDAMEVIYKYICNEQCFSFKGGNFRMVIQLPVFKQEDITKIDKLVENLGNPKWILLKRIDHLATLPYSTDIRHRIQITFIAGTELQLSKRVKYLGTRLEDVTVGPRIRDFIKYLNDRFPKMINKKYYAK